MSLSSVAAAARRAQSHAAVNLKKDEHGRFQPAKKGDLALVEFFHSSTRVNAGTIEWSDFRFALIEKTNRLGRVVKVRTYDGAVHAYKPRQQIWVIRDLDRAAAIWGDLRDATFPTPDVARAAAKFAVAKGGCL